jgi:DNA-binding IclR family transcriptional regulator
MQLADTETTASEAEILRLFRSYRVRASEMLFFNQGVSKARPAHLSRALQSLIERGLVIKERHPDAYSLTPRGYRASLAV